MIGNQLCSCANPDCIANGCLLLRQYRYGEHPCKKQDFTFTPDPLTEQDIRRIIREELDSINRKEK